jgi:hypothetical protein
MTEQKEQPSSEQSVSLTLCKKPQKELFFSQLSADLVQAMQLLYESDSLSIPTLNQIFKNILSDFSQRDDIPKIDIFAILNSLRKMREISFVHDSKNWTFCFSRETSLTYGKSKAIITVESSMIIGFFQPIICRLGPIQQDLLFLMYKSILINHEVSPKIPNFELTIEQDFEYWCDLLKWETERKKFLSKCNNFYNQPFFSNSQAKTHIKEYQSSGVYFPSSFQEFLGRSDIRERLQVTSWSHWDFDPIS